MCAVRRRAVRKRRGNGRGSKSKVKGADENARRGGNSDAFPGECCAATEPGRARRSGSGNTRGRVRAWGVSTAGPRHRVQHGQEHGDDEADGMMGALGL